MTMRKISYCIAAGFALRHLIKTNYASQQEFAEHFGVDLRTVNRYITVGINKMITVEEIADFFDMELIDFLLMGKMIGEDEA